MSKLVFLKIILFYVLICSLISNAYSFKPTVIAILANSQPDDAEDIQSSRVNYQYVRWLEQSRAEVVVIQPWYNENEVEDILSKVNGVLWQGGNRNLKLGGEYEKVAQIILEKIIMIYDTKGISIPLWGTCQGFELLHSLLANSTDVLTSFKAHNIKTPLIIEETSSVTNRMFSDFSNQDLFNIQNLNTTAQFHNFGVSDLQYKKYKILDDVLQITSHGKDLNDNLYIATVEGKKYPLFAVQFHPEMVSYTPEDYNGVPQSLEAIKIAQLFSNFFIKQAQMNNNTISQEDMRKYDYLNSYEKLPVYQEEYYFYFFNKNDRKSGNVSNKQSLDIKKLEKLFLSNI